MSDDIVAKLSPIPRGGYSLMDPPTCSGLIVDHCIASEMWKTGEIDPAPSLARPITHN